MFNPFVCITSGSCTSTLSLPWATLPPILLSFWKASGSSITHIKPFCLTLALTPLALAFPVATPNESKPTSSGEFLLFYLFYFNFLRLCFYFPQHFILGNSSNMLLWGRRGKDSLFYFGKLPLFHFVQFHDHLSWYLPVVVLK